MCCRITEWWWRSAVMASTVSARLSPTRSPCFPGWGCRAMPMSGSTVQHRSRVAADPRSRTCARYTSSMSSCMPSCASSALTSPPGRWARTSSPAASNCLGSLATRSCNSGSTPWSSSPACATPARKSTPSRPGLLKAVIGRDQNGDVVRKAGVMAIVVYGGPVRPGGSIQVCLPTGPHHALERV